MVPLLVLAGGLALLSGFLVWSAARSSRRAARLTATPTRTAADLRDEGRAVVTALGPAAMHREAEVVGTGEPGPQPLVGPYSGQPVLWYRARTVHHYWRTTTTRDSEGRRRTSRTRQEDVVAEQVSSSPLLVRDPTGTVRVEVVGAEVDSPRTTHDRMEASAPRTTTLSLGPFSLSSEDDDDIGHQYVEEALLPGEPLYVCGTARTDPDGTVVLSGTDDARLLLSTRREEQLVRDHVRAGQWQAAVGGLAGLSAVGCVVAALLR